MEKERLIHLLNAYPDGSLGTSEVAELEGALKESPEARTIFWEVASLHGLTFEAAKLKWTQHREAAPAQAPAKSGRQHSHPGWPVWAWAGEAVARWRRPFRWAWPWGFAAVGVLILVNVWVVYGIRWMQVAELARAVDMEWEEEGTLNTLAPGSSMKRRSYHLKRGAVQIRFHNGATMIFEAPAQFRIDSGRQVHCQLGRFRVHVPSKARGFTLTLEGLGVVDLGTEFGLSVPPSGPAEVHVFSGEVEVTRTESTATGLLLVEGEAVRVEPDHFDRMNASYAGFLSEVGLARRDQLEVRQRFQAWRKESEALDRDPSVLLHYTFEQSSPWDQVVHNDATNALPQSHGLVSECRWSEGRWPGKKALEIRHPKDRVRLQLSQTMRSATCLVWVRVDNLPNGFVHSLLTSDAEKAGSLRWTIGRGGNLRLGLATAGTGPEASWNVGESQPAVRTNMFGKWMMLATVYDGGKVFHYLDGRLVWSNPVKAPETLSFGWVELGNWVATVDHPDFQWAKTRSASYFARDFEGRFDEVAVLSRAMTAEEIQRFYEAGRPMETASAAEPK